MSSSLKELIWQEQMQINKRVLMTWPSLLFAATFRDVKRLHYPAVLFPTKVKGQKGWAKPPVLEFDWRVLLHLFWVSSGFHYWDLYNKSKLTSEVFFQFWNRYIFTWSFGRGAEWYFSPLQCHFEGGPWPLGLGPSLTLRVCNRQTELCLNTPRGAISACNLSDPYMNDYLQHILIGRSTDRLQSIIGV